MKITNNKHFKFDVPKQRQSFSIKNQYDGGAFKNQQQSEHSQLYLDLNFQCNRSIDDDLDRYQFSNHIRMSQQYQVNSSQLQISIQDSLRQCHQPLVTPTARLQTSKLSQFSQMSQKTSGYRYEKTQRKPTDTEWRRSSFQVLTERSITMSEFQFDSQFLYDEEDIKSKKKKMGLQLSILEKNILSDCPHKTNKARRFNKTALIKRVNSNILKQNPNSFNKNITFQAKPQQKKINLMQTNINKLGSKNKVTPISFITKQQNPTLKKLQNCKGNFQSACQSQGSDLQPINSADLQQIRKFDKDIYKLYLDLLNDYRVQLDKQKENTCIIDKLNEQIRLQNAKQSQMQRKIDDVRERAKEMQLKIKTNQAKWIQEIREYTYIGIQEKQSFQSQITIMKQNCSQQNTSSIQEGVI